MSNLLNLLILLSLVTSNIYIAESYTLTASVLTQKGYNNQSTIINIYDHNIDKIDPKALNGYDKLSQFIMTTDSLLSIDMEVFKDAVNLQYLVLNAISLNQFTNSKNTILPNLIDFNFFSNLTSFNKAMFNAFPALYFFKTYNVYAFHGSLKTVDVHTFESLPQLVVIDLRFNSITGFEYLQIPTSLYQLDLSLNYMNYFALSRTMGVLDILDISGNRFRSFKSMNFSFLANLTRLYLSNNPHAYPYEIPGHLKPLTKLQHVGLANLSIGSIDSNYFKNNTNLQYIDLSQNLISSLDSGAFNGLNDLNTVLLNENYLTKISSGTFNNPSFSLINLVNNQISQIDSFSFYGNPNLVQVNLANNKLTKILPRTFNNGFSYIILNYNQITEIENTTFDGVSSIKYLDLSINEIEKIAAGSFNNLGLQTILLNDNKLSTIEPGTFANLPNLQKVFLSNNQLTQLDSSMFAGSNNLLGISVYGNPNLSTANIQSLCPPAAANCKVYY